MTAFTSALKVEWYHTWAIHAKYGVEVVYHRGDAERDEKVFDYMRKLSDAGMVFLFQRRLNDGRWEKVARRTPVASHKVLDTISQDVQVPPSSACLKERGISA